jgi:hypothetical protein
MKFMPGTIELCCISSLRVAVGENIDRNGACKDTSKSVIVKTTDTCPCNYPNNYFSECQIPSCFKPVQPVIHTLQ